MKSERIGSSKGSFERFSIEKLFIGADTLRVVPIFFMTEIVVYATMEEHF